MKIIYIISGILLVVLLGACATTNMITIQTLNPAGLTLSENAGEKNIIIVDNTSTKNAEEDAKNSSNESIISIDSIKTSILYSIVQFMNEEGYFNTTNIYAYKIRENDTSEDVKLMSPKQASEIGSESNADILVSLDEFNVWGFIEPTNDNMLELKVASVLRVYSAANGRIIQPPIVYMDSLYWFDIYSIKQIDAAVKEMSSIAADRLVSIFVPSWEVQDRWYFSDGSKDMKEAARLVKENNWKEAAIIWGNLFEKEDKDNRKVKLASNIALANECMDDIPNALVWINIAYDLLPESSRADYALKTFLYRNALIKRETNMNELKKQLEK